MKVNLFEKKKHPNALMYFSFYQIMPKNIWLNLMMKTKSNYFLIRLRWFGSYMENAAIYMLFAIVRQSKHTWNKVYVGKNKNSYSTGCDGGHGLWVST